MDTRLVKNKIQEINSEEQLPLGTLISYKGDPLDRNSQIYYNTIAAWQINSDSSGSDNAKKEIIILSTRDQTGGVAVQQLKKDAELKGYVVKSFAVSDSAFISSLYEKKRNSMVQEATLQVSEHTVKFEQILRDAIRNQVSDIHFEIRRSGCVIRMRQNGDMRVYNKDDKMTHEQALSFAGVVYNVLGENKSVAFNEKKFQQASVSYTIDDIQLRLRFQSIRAYPEGCDIILRVLTVGGSEDFVPLQDLGYTEQQVSDLIRITSRSVGSLIIAGVTNSGKSTTMKNLLLYIYANSGYRVKIITIEDPPEYSIAGVTQIPVVVNDDDRDKQSASPFEAPIKACMRGDPDIIMIGEVRDSVTGDLMKKAIQSGHQVLTTVHAPSALGILERLTDFSVTRSVLGSPDFLSGLLYQKLLPVLCQHCAEDFHEVLASDKVSQSDAIMAAKIQRVLKSIPNKNYSFQNFNIKTRSRSGCEHCKFTSISGRTVSAEVISIDLNMLNYIDKNEMIPLMKYWRGLSDKDPFSENMSGKTCMEHGFLKVLQGIVCPFDLERAFKPIEEMLLQQDGKNAETVTTGGLSGGKNKDWVGI